MTDDIDRFNSVANTRGDHIKLRWITRGMYVKIQGSVMLNMLRKKVAAGPPAELWKRKKYNEAKYALETLEQCKTVYDLEQWLRGQKGQALLSCDFCKRTNLDEVLEAKNLKTKERRRMCNLCHQKVQTLQK
jgi:hypothetical protein